MLKRLSLLEAAVCFALLAVITGLVFVAAILRFFGHPLTWSVDMAQLLFIWLCFFGAARAMREKSHLGMEVLVKYLGYRRQFWLEMACSALVLIFLAFLAVEGLKLTWLNSERQFGDSTLSYAWVTVAVPVGCAMIAVALAHNMVVAWRRRAEGVLVYSRTAADRDEPAVVEL
ncbi:TRAP transporter small permease [Chthonobacter albigriseus]|uniref:TRAP transporter small permease n=1 Tax=Chthonobacter albigriseus TaxID=1683161 RepID=UPI0015EEA3DB|nr:TRAP transporter small permease [Chthonobacter albigriseus]